MFIQWEGFNIGNWTETIDVRDFIFKNFSEYLGDASFLSNSTSKTSKVWEKANNLIIEEIKKGIIDVETTKFSGIGNFDAGYIDKDNEVIVGLQTDAPLKRIMNPYGGMRMVKQSLNEYGFQMDIGLEKNFNEFKKTHNDGVFDTYSNATKIARHVGLLTGLPDAYGRGRIIGDYRRIALYGIDYLIANKKIDKTYLDEQPTTEENIRRREEISEEIKALNKIKKFAAQYKIDISSPAQNSREAVQFLYFGYLAAVQENNGAAMSLGRNTAFLDIYIERDLKNGTLTENTAQELIDQLVIKLRLVRHLRTPEYNSLFAGDPNWITESLGGMSLSGKSLVTKTTYRFIHTLNNLSPAPEPNMTILWSEKLPENFKKYCAKMSIETDSLQYENDDMMRHIFGDDYAIACCVSAMQIGKQMQFFGARANLAKSLLYAINGGIDEIKKNKDGSLITVVPGVEKITEDILDYNKVKFNYDKVLDYVAKLYVDTMNVIHYMHDKYAYEAGQMALHDTNIGRYISFGIAGLSCAADSLSAIKYAKVKPIRNEDGIAVDFEVYGSFPKFGNDDDEVDDFAIQLVKDFTKKLRKHPTYRNADVSLSALTITSNVVYGKKTGSTPDGRKKGEPLAPGANPMHGRDINGALASLNSVAKIPYSQWCQDGISNTFSIVPNALGIEKTDQIHNLVTLLDGYFAQNAFHLNVNVLNRETLKDAMENPDKYPTLTIRVSGYAVHFNRLTKEQQLEVIKRTFHEKI
ncbi:formate C-acetyltransferase [Clostridium rectalis]|uniref:formate C-acetyltransferase n=1 Tax=Clostridium rectalis TaxID=2040295 RepID=UPI000F636199|nr:formate C-acetyltransferase [Clostridium rectalis]